MSGNNKNFRMSLASNFKVSGLTFEQMLNSCKQYLHAKKFDEKFNELTISEQESYLVNKNILGMRYLGGRNLIEILNSNPDVTLIDVYMAIQEQRRNSCELDFIPIFEGKDDILIFGVEQFLNKFSEIANMNKKFTFISPNERIIEILKFDFAKNENLVFEVNDLLHGNTLNKKFDTIFCIPPFGIRHLVKRGSKYGNDSSTVLSEILYNEFLNDNGVFYTVLPVKVNFSQDEAHFRFAFERNIARVVSLPSDTFGMTKIKTYLFELHKNNVEKMYYSESVSVLGDEYTMKDFITNEKWNFEKPFKNEDKEIQTLMQSNTVSIKEVATVLRGKALSKSIEETDSDGGFTYIDLKSIKNGEINYAETKSYCLDNMCCDYLQDGDLLVKNKGLVQVAMYKDNGKKCIASANLIVIRADRNKINPEYLMLYLRSNLGNKLISSIQRGTAMPFINHRDLQDLPFLNVSLAEQNEFLGEYKKLYDEYEALQKLADEKKSYLEQESDKFFSGQNLK